MKELKFRAWIKNYNCYADVLGFEQGRLFVQFQSGERAQHRLYVPIEDCVLEQYTGLKDMNGREIYEKDIVAVKDNDIPFALANALTTEKWLVRFNKHRAAFTMVKSTRRRNLIRTFQNTKQDDIEVIGNIHENPELLG